MRKRTNNQILLEGIIEEFKKENKIKNKKEAFDFFAIEQITKNLDICWENYNNSVIDGKSDGGIDSILLFANNDCFETLESLKSRRGTYDISIYILQIKNKEKIEEDVITRLYPTLKNILDLDTDLTKFRAYSVELIEKANLIREAWKYSAKKSQNFQISIFYISRAEFKNLSGSFIEKQKQIETMIEDLGVKNRFNKIGAKELLDLSRKKENYNAELKFDKMTNSQGGEGYIGFVKLDDYYRCITDNGELRENIFEENVRDHLQNVEINREIFETLKSKKRDNFWCLNNGITMISSSIKRTGDSLNMQNVQIVNGLQTSYQIYNAKKKEKVEFEQDNFLVVKVVGTEDEELKGDIIRCTNKQTAITSSGFRALDRIQIDIEDYFKKHGIYYDRRKNYYKNRGIQTSKIVSIQLLAQCVFSTIYKQPSIARSKPASLNKDEDNYKKIFLNIGDNLWLYLFCIRLFKKIDIFLKDLKKEFQNDDSEIERVIASNYKFHVCRMVMSSLIQLPDYNLKQVINSKEKLERLIESEKFEDRIYKSFSELVETMRDYLARENKNIYDLISISKNPLINELITQKLNQNHKTEKKIKADKQRVLLQRAKIK